MLGEAAIAGVTAGSSVAFILLACSSFILIYKWHQRKHSGVVHLSQHTMRKLSADLERNEGKGPNYILTNMQKTFAFAVNP